MNTDIFPFGATYAPVAKATEISSDEWDDDLRRMKEQGFNTFRAFVAWDRVEQKEGERDFDKLDYVFTLAEKHGLRISLNIGGVFDNLISIYPPVWLSENYDCHLQMNHHSNPEKWIGNYKRICIHDPIYREKAEDFLREVITRYAEHPVLDSWVAWNEPAYSECFCEQTQACFREWLKEKYDDINELNSAWSTEYPMNYTSFDKILPPTGVGFMGGGYTSWLDWRKFGDDTIAGAMQWVTDLVKTYDPLCDSHPTTTNLVGSSTTAKGVNQHRDGWKMGQAVDVIGLSQYTYWGSPWWYSASTLDRIRGFSAHPKQDFFVLEYQGGPVLWVHNNMPAYTQIEERMLRNWQMVGHGAKMLLGWLYRTRVTDAQAGEFGMVAWDGEPTERSRAAGKMSLQIQKYAELFNSARPVSAQIALLADHSTGQLGVAEGYGADFSEKKNYWDCSWMGAYKILWDNKIPVDILSDKDILDGKLDSYKALIIPFRQNMEQNIANKIGEFVKDGGYAAADFPLGMKNNRGILYTKAPGCGLDEVFGGSYNDALPAQTETIDLKDGTLKNHVFQMQLKALANAEVVGKREGDPAIIMNTHGKGKTLLAGTMLFERYNAEFDPAVSGLLLDFISEAGVGAGFTVAGVSDEAARDVEVCQLHSEKGNILIINNYNKENVSVTLKSAVPFTGVIREIIREGEIEYTGSELNLEIPAEQTAVLVME